MLGTLYSFAVDKIDVLVVTPLVTLFLILDTTHPHFPTTVIPHRCHTEGLSATPVWESLKIGRLRKVEQDETNECGRIRKEAKGDKARECWGYAGSLRDVCGCHLDISHAERPSGASAYTKSSCVEKSLRRLQYFHGLSHPLTSPTSTTPTLHIPAQTRRNLSNNTLSAEKHWILVLSSTANVLFYAAL